VVVPILICKVWLEVVVIARARGRSSPCSLKKRLLRPRDSPYLLSRQVRVLTDLRCDQSDSLVAATRAHMELALSLKIG